MRLRRLVITGATKPRLEPDPRPNADPCHRCAIDHAGGCATLARELGLPFSGDVLFAGGIGRTDFPGGDHATLIHGITSRLWAMGDDTVFIVGHGPESSFCRERRSKPFVAGT